MEYKRLFIAIPVPEAIKQYLQCVEQWGNYKNIRWVPSENLHLTVHFLGKTATEKLPFVEETLEKVAHESNAFELRFRRFRTIYKSRKPVMVWAEFHKYEIFSEIVSQFRRFFESKEEKAPVPHITLGRFKKGGQFIQQKESERVDNKIILPVRQIELWESTLSPEGAVYITLRSCTLKE